MHEQQTTLGSFVVREMISIGAFVPVSAVQYIRCRRVNSLAAALTTYRTEDHFSSSFSTNAQQCQDIFRTTALLGINSIFDLKRSLHFCLSTSSQHSFSAFRLITLSQHSVLVIRLSSTSQHSVSALSLSTQS